MTNYVYEASSDPGAIGEYGTEAGHLYLKVELGPDGQGNPSGHVIVSVSDGALFKGYASTSSLSAGKPAPMIYKQGEDKRSLRLAGKLVMGPEFAYDRYEDIGWATVTFSLRCP